MSKGHLCAALAAGMLLTPIGASAQVAVPSIEVAPSEAGITVTGVVTGLSSGAVDAVMTISRRDKSGSVQTSQARHLQVSRDSRDTVATTGLSAGPGAHIRITLKLKQNDAVIAVSQTEIGTDE